MADDNAKLLIVLEAQSKKLQNQLVAATKTIDRFAAQTNRRFDSMNAKNAASFDSLNKRVGASMGLMSGAIAKAFAGAAALRGAQVLIDSATRIENSLKVAGLAGEELDKVYDSLYSSAQRNAVPIEALAELYGRAALAQKELNVTSQELLGFSENVARALRVAGKSAEESRGALLQFSQAIGAGIVRAEEFNSILEGALPIAQAAAAGLEEAGGSVSKLRLLIIDGKVSSEAFFRAFEAGSVILTDKLANAELTVSQGFIRLQNVLIDTAGRLDDALGASEGAATGLDRLATAIQNVGDYFERNAERIKPFFDAIAAADSFDPAAFREKLGLGVIDDFLEGTSLIEGRFGLASQQIVQDASAIEAQLLNAMAAMIGLNDATGLSPDQLATFQALIAQMEAGETGADELRAALIEMGASPVNFMIAFSGLNELIGKLRETRSEAGATAAAIAAAASGQSSGSNVEDQRGEQLASRPRVAIKPVTLEDYPIVGGGGSGKGGSKKSPGETFADSLEKQREENRLLAEKTALQATLNPLVNDYGFAMEKLAVQQELQTAATAAGLELTPGLKATIDELATGYANASVEAARLAESQEQLKQISDDFGEAGKSAIKGFISDLREGKSAADALGNAMSSILDSVIDIGLNALLGGLTGGGGGLFAGLFGFANGGYTGAGPKNKPAGVVHAGEVVWSQKDIARAGGVGVVEAMRRGYANGGIVGGPGPVTPRAGGGSLHITVGVSADSAGNLTPFVESVADSRVAKAAPTIGGAAVRTSLSQAPMATSEYQARHG